MDIKNCNLNIHRSPLTFCVLSAVLSLYATACDENSGNTHTHSIVKVDAVDATCETAGNRVYYKCSSCEKICKDEACASETTLEAVSIPAKGHMYGDVSYRWNSSYTECTAFRTCQADSSHVDSETVSSVMETTATCETGGKSTFTATFTNPEFIPQTISKQQEALGHDYTEPTYTWSEDYGQCTALKVCARDETHNLTETVNSSSISTSTCTTSGVVTYTAKFNHTEHFPEQTLTFQASASGHSFGKTVYTWNEDNTECTATRVCRNDETHIETESVSVTSEITATCEKNGKTIYAVTFANPFFEPVIKEIPLSMYCDTTVASEGLAGTGEKSDPYLIQNASDLKYLTNSVYDGTLETKDKYFKLMSDIKFDDSSTWLPIGSEHNPFRGNFDGNNHVVSGTIHFIEIDESVSFTHANLGFFGETRGNSDADYPLISIENLHMNAVIHSAVLSRDYVILNLGSVIGEAYDTLIKNCTNSGTIHHTTSDYIGGIVGYLYNSTIENCANQGNIVIYPQVRNSKIGGIVGGSASYRRDNHISHSTNYGDILYDNSDDKKSIVGEDLTVGGVIGRSWDVHMSHSHNAGNIQVIPVIADNSVILGGIVGSLVQHNTIHHSSNSGDIIATSMNEGTQRIGGIAGHYQYIYDYYEPNTYGEEPVTYINLLYSCVAHTGKVNGSLPSDDNRIGFVEDFSDPEDSGLAPETDKDKIVICTESHQG